MSGAVTVTVFPGGDTGTLPTPGGPVSVTVVVPPPSGSNAKPNDVPPAIAFVFWAFG